VPNLGAQELIVILFIVTGLVIPLVLVALLTSASLRYERNVALVALLDSSDDLLLAGVGRRLLAFLIDLLVLGGLVLLISVVASALDRGGDAAAGIGFLVAWLIYFAGMEAVWGATLGKMALRLWVIRADGGKPGFGAAMVRTIFKYGGAFTPIGIIVTLVCITGSPAAQRFGDRLAGTTVIRRPRRRHDPAWSADTPLETTAPTVEAPPADTASKHGSGDAGLPTAPTAAAAEPTEDREAAAVATVGTPVPARYCAHCGTRFDFDDDRYCPRCGHARIRG